MSYPSDLSDRQWQRPEKFFERSDPRGARSKYPKRRVVEAVLYRLREGCRWRALPHDFPPWDTVYDHWRRWQKRGVWPQAVAVLGTRWREVALGRVRRAPRHAILDSQAVKTAAEGEARGLHGGKKVKGRARHVAVDSQGTLLAVHVCAANKADGAEAGTVMVQAPVTGELHRGHRLQTSRRAGGPRATRCGTPHHHQTQETETEQMPDQKGGGFKPVAFRWRVERTFAWLGQCRLLSKEYEKTVDSAEAWLWCAMTRLLIRRLAV